MSTLSMEALSSSSFIPKLRISSSEHSIATGCCPTGRGVSEFNLSLSYTTTSRCVPRVFALAHGDNEHDNPLIGGNGSVLFPQELISISQILKKLALSFKHVVEVVFGTPNFVPKGSFDQEQPSEKDAATTSDVVLPPYHGGTRAGLFRTPISGGVQSATSCHGLPKPSLAVRNLMEQARFAHLCTTMSRIHHRRDGYPFGSLVDFAPDSLGHPLFSFSPLAIHTRNVLADPRCTLVVQIPGWSGLSNARVTIFGDVVPLPKEYQEWAHKQYIAKHQHGPSQQWGNFHYFRMQNISDIHFIGSFGTVAWIDVKEYETVQPDKIAGNGVEQNLKELNAIFSKPLKELLSQEGEVDDAALISLDSKGTDIRVRQGAQFNMQRISFEEGYAVETLEQAKAALWKLINKGRVHNLRL